MKDKQIISKKRVTDHGEVFTSEREVKAMLDLVKMESFSVDSRCLEPACGTGNFLIELLERKLSIVKNEYSKNQLVKTDWHVVIMKKLNKLMAF